MVDKPIEYDTLSLEDLTEMLFIRTRHYNIWDSVTEDLFKATFDRVNESKQTKNLLILNLDKIKNSGKLELFRKFMCKNNLFAYSEIQGINRGDLIDNLTEIETRTNELLNEVRSIDKKDLENKTI